jgi:hypothetical protein
MPKPTPRHRTYYEGDDDGTVLQVLAELGLLPPDLDIVQRHHRKTNPGKDGMVKDIAALVNPAGGAGLSAIAVRDIDDLTLAQAEAWLLERLREEIPAKEPPVQCSQVETGVARLIHVRLEVPGGRHTGRVVGVCVGLHEGVACKEYGIAQFAVDDHVLHLALDRAVYDAVSEFQEVPYDTARHKLTQIVQIMRENGVPIKHTKRLMHLFRAVAGFRASPATFADRIIRKASEVLGRDQVREAFAPLITCLEEASRILSP